MDEITQAIREQYEDFPYPAFDLINHPDYMIIMTARGCPYDCSFCAQKKIAYSDLGRFGETGVEQPQ